MTKSFNTACVSGFLCLGFAFLMGCSSPKTEEKAQEKSAPSMTQATTKMKPGLWEVEMTTNLMPMPIKGKLCLSQDFEKEIAEISKPEMASGDCEQPKITSSPGGKTIDLVCKTEKGSMTTKSQIDLSQSDRFEQNTDMSFTDDKGTDSKISQKLVATHISDACLEGMKPGGFNLGF